MTRIVYVNGTFVPETDAVVSIFDRGFLMADGVYEVTSVIEGKLVDFKGHMARLHRSLRELDMPVPCSDDDMLAMHRSLIARNNITQGMIYLQVTRGNPGDRSFVFPSKDIAPTLVAFTQDMPDLVDAPAAKTGFRVISAPDMRWGRRDIKTIQLLYPSMGKMMAKSAGVDDTWFTEDGMVTEGTSNNAYIVKGHTIITRHLGTEILHGITRAAVLRFAKEMQYTVEERSFSIKDAQEADEAFATAATIFVMPVIELDGKTIGSGTPGPVATRLRNIYIDEMRKTAV